MRVISLPPLSENFESLAPGSLPKHWISAGGKYGVREVDGNKVLVKNPEPQALQTRAFILQPA